MPAATLRQALEHVIAAHPYGINHQSCKCVIDFAGPDDTIAPITREQHAAHVTNLVLGLLEGPAQILGLEVA